MLETRETIRQISITANVDGNEMALLRNSRCHMHRTRFELSPFEFELELGSNKPETSQSYTSSIEFEHELKLLDKFSN